MSKRKFRLFDIQYVYNMLGLNQECIVKLVEESFDYIHANLMIIGTELNFWISCYAVHIVFPLTKLKKKNKDGIKETKINSVKDKENHPTIYSLPWNNNQNQYLLK